MEPEYERNRPVAVMLNNLKKAQPQLGNAQADIIYEVPAEGGITRMLAVYQTLDGIGTLGSIRSSRPYYIELALGHDALYVHAGGSPEAYQDLKSWKVNNIDGVNGSASQSAVFWRDQERRKTMGLCVCASLKPGMMRSPPRSISPPSARLMTVVPKTFSQIEAMSERMSSIIPLWSVYAW